MKPPRKYKIETEKHKAWWKDLTFSIAFLLLSVFFIFLEIRLGASQHGKVNGLSNTIDHIRFPLFGVSVALFTFSLSVDAFIQRTSSTYEGIERKLILGQKISFFNTYMRLTIMSLPIMFLCVILYANLMLLCIFLLNLILICSVLFRHLTLSLDKNLSNKLSQIIKDIVSKSPRDAAKKIMINADLFFNLLGNKTISFRYTDILRENYHRMNNDTLGMFIFLGMVYYECVTERCTESFFDFTILCNRILKTHPVQTLRFGGNCYENLLDDADDKLQYIRESNWPDILYTLEPWFIKLQEKNKLSFIEITNIENELWMDFSLAITRSVPYVPKRRITMTILIDDAGENINGN